MALRRIEDERGRVPSAAEAARALGWRVGDVTGRSTPQITRRMGLSTSQASRLVVGATRELRAALAA